MRSSPRRFRPRRRSPLPTTSIAIAEEEGEEEEDRRVQKALAANEVRMGGEVKGLTDEMEILDLRDLRRLKSRWMPRSADF